MLKLTERLSRLASYVDRQALVADIGTDHARLPVYLIQSGICERVIASELHLGPLAAARTMIDLFKMGQQIDLREGDGLQILQPGEADLLIIAGMGGLKIRDILAASPAVLRSVKRLVLQPLGGESQLRNWLLENGWVLATEDLVLEDDRFYVIIVAEPGIAVDYDPTAAVERQVACGSISFNQDELLVIGPKLVESNHPLLIPYLEKNIRDFEAVARSLKRARTPAAKLMQQEWYEKIEFLRKVIACQPSANK